VTSGAVCDISETSCHDTELPSLQSSTTGSSGPVGYSGLRWFPPPTVAGQRRISTGFPRWDSQGFNQAFLPEFNIRRRTSLAVCGAAVLDACGGVLAAGTDKATDEERDHYAVGTPIHRRQASPRGRTGHVVPVVPPTTHNNWLRAPCEPHT